MQSINYIKKAGFLLLGVSIMIAPGCKKEQFDFSKLTTPEWNPNVAAPLAFSTLELSSLMVFPDSGDIQLIEDSNNFLSLYYSSSLYAVTVDEFVSLPEQETSIAIGANDTVVQVAQVLQFLGIDTTFSMPYSNTSSFDFPNGEEIDSILFSGGTLNLDISSDFRHDIVLDVTIPSATKNGVAYSQVVNLDYTGSTPVIYSEAVDLSGYKLDISEGTNGTPNTFSLDYLITMSYSSSESILASDSLTMDMGFANLAFDKVFGFLGTQTINIDEETVEFSTGGINMYMADPRLSIIVNNSIGLPIDASLSSLYGTTESGTISLTGIPDPIEFEEPREVGDIETTTIDLNASNSNLAEFLASGLTAITFGGSATTNPDGAGTQNFVTSDAQFSLDMIVELPLWGSIENISVVDTMEFGVDALNGFESADFLLNVENGFPFDIDLQLYFVDDNYIVQDSLIKTNQTLIPSASVDGNGDVTDVASNQTTISVDQSTLSKIMNATQIILVGSISTANDGTTPVKIYSDYSMDFQLGVKAQL